MVFFFFFFLWRRRRRKKKENRGARARLFKLPPPPLHRTTYNTKRRRIVKNIYMKETESWQLSSQHKRLWKESFLGLFFCLILFSRPPSIATAAIVLVLDDTRNHRAAVFVLSFLPRVCVSTAAAAMANADTHIRGFFLSFVLFRLFSLAMKTFDCRSPPPPPPPPLQILNSLFFSSRCTTAKGVYPLAVFNNGRRLTDSLTESVCEREREREREAFAINRLQKKGGRDSGNDSVTLYRSYVRSFLLSLPRRFYVIIRTRHQTKQQQQQQQQSLYRGGSGRSIPPFLSLSLLRINIDVSSSSTSSPRTFQLLRAARYYVLVLPRFFSSSLLFVIYCTIEQMAKIEGEKERRSGVQSINRRRRCLPVCGRATSSSFTVAVAANDWPRRVVCVCGSHLEAPDSRINEQRALAVRRALLYWDSADLDWVVKVDLIPHSGCLPNRAVLYSFFFFFFSDQSNKSNKKKRTTRNELRFGWVRCDVMWWWKRNAHLAAPRLVSSHLFIVTRSLNNKTTVSAQTNDTKSSRWIFCCRCCCCCCFCHF